MPEEVARPFPFRRAVVDGLERAPVGLPRVALRHPDGAGAFPPLAVHALDGGLGRPRRARRGGARVGRVLRRLRTRALRDLHGRRRRRGLVRRAPRPEVPPRRGPGAARHSRACCCIHMLDSEYSPMVVKLKSTFLAKTALKELSL